MLDDPRPGVLLAAGVPFVAFGRPWGQPDATHAWVDINGASATAAATRALIEAGLAPVGWLGWPNGSGLGADRRSGWWDAVGADGVHLEEAAEEGIAEGRDAMAALLERGARSVVCASDSLPSGAVLALQDRGGGPRDRSRPRGRVRQHPAGPLPAVHLGRATHRGGRPPLRGTPAGRGGGTSTPGTAQVLLTPTVILRSADGSEAPLAP